MWRSAVAAAILLPATALIAAGPTVTAGAATRSAHAVATSAGDDADTATDPASLVHPLDGTGTGSVSPGTVGEFPGADLPFGMIQWSPDTTPNAVQSGGGYDVSDSRIGGFSLTHLSGTGCPSYQDVPILPTVGAVGAAPESASQPFSHHEEEAAPGRYRVELNPGPSAIDMSLAVTTRTGIAQVTFPQGAQSNLLFKVGGSINPVSGDQVRIVGNDEVEGQVTSGQFCGTGNNYTVHFVAQFEHPFTAHGTWTTAGVDTGAGDCTGTSCGAYVSFDTNAADAASRTITMKVALSFVSTPDAAANLAAEDPGWSLAHVADQATARWNQVLGRIDAAGGTAAEEHTFYTALYHSLLFPNVVSDDNGDYDGDGGHTAKVDPGHHDEYADFSEWDIYRSEVQLISLLSPSASSDMVQSLVDDAEQNGWLPKWAIVGGDESQMNGDSADPIIADAYAMGATHFDATAALAAMVKGASENETGHGLEIERQYLSQYLSQHYVNAGSLDLTSIDYSIGGSVTLEYAIDDFAIAQLAESLHKTSTTAEMASRAANWEYEFDPATGYIQARGTDGSFPPGAAFETSQFEPGGQTGFEEGNAIQYTWSVPQDLSALASLMGGDAAATKALTTYFSSFNATRYQPYDWSGNEPSEWAPWEFDAFGAPEDTQSTVRSIVNDEYADAPVDEPGNDDLGALSSWYVWGAMGLFPITPGTATLALASPLFPSVRILLPDGHRLVENAQGAAASRPYIRALTVHGVARPTSAGDSCASASNASAGATTAGQWNLPWLPASVIKTGGTLDFTLSAEPDASWGAAPNDALPSYATGQLPAVAYSVPSGALAVGAGAPTTLQLGAASADAKAVTVLWHAVSLPAGVTVTPSSGTLTSSSCGAPSPDLTSLQVSAANPGTYPIDITFHAASGATLPPVVVDVTAAG
jgi:predicted alpha-1,2-mannosidase